MTETGVRAEKREKDGKNSIFRANQWQFSGNYELRQKPFFVWSTRKIKKIGTCTYMCLLLWGCVQLCWEGDYLATVWLMTNLLTKISGLINKVTQPNWWKWQSTGGGPSNNNPVVKEDSVDFWFLNWVRSSIASSIDEKLSSPWHWCCKNCLTSQPGKSELMSLTRRSFTGLLF